MRQIGKKMMAALLAGMMTFTTAAQTVASAIETKLDTHAEVSVSDDGLTVGMADPFGSILAKEVSAEQTEQLANSGCDVLSIEMNGTEANVEFQTLHDCTLVIGVYDESGETLFAVGSTEVLHDQTNATVSIGMDAMPAYFYLKGYLIDTESLEPLSRIYENPLYTQEMQEFFSKTVDDFDTERVVNFDDDPTNNFVVYDENVILVPQNDDGYNIIASADNEAYVYVIENADETILSLEKNDVLSYQYNENDLLIVKVEEIDVEDTTVTIKAADIMLDDVFEYVRIDVTEKMEDAEIIPAEGAYIEDENGNIIESYSAESSSKAKLAKGNEPVDDDDADKEFELLKYKIKKEFQYPDDSGSAAEEIVLEKSDNSILNVLSDYVEGEGEISGNVSFSCDISFKLYSAKGIKYAEFIMNYAIGVGVTAEGKLRLKFDIGKILPIKNEKLKELINVECHPQIVIQFSGDFTEKIEATGGFFGCKTFKIGRHRVNEPVKKSPSLEGTVEGKIAFFVGVIFEPEIGVGPKDGKKLLFTELEAEIGVEFAGEIKASGDLRDHTPDTYHMCALCVDGDVSLVGKIKFEFEFDFWKFESIDVEGEALNTRIKLLDFYYSFDEEKGGLGKCPNIAYRTEIHCEDENGKPVSNAEISFNNLALIQDVTRPMHFEYLKVPVLTDAAGSIFVYVPEGFMSMNIVKEGYVARDCSFTLTISNKDMPIIDGVRTSRFRSVLYTKKRTVSICVTDEKGNSLQGAAVSISEVSGSASQTDAEGICEMELETGSYNVIVSKENYETKECKFTVTWDTKQLNVVLESAVTKEPPEDTVFYNGHAYKCYNLMLSWDEAKAYCENLGGHLAVITTTGEQEFIESILESNATQEMYWLGAEDTKIEGIWRWINGEAFSYTNWCNNNPDNCTDGNPDGEDYLGILTVDSFWIVGDDSVNPYEWNDFTNGGDGYQFGFICEWDTVPQTQQSHEMLEATNEIAKSAFVLAQSSTATTKSYTDLLPDNLYNFYVLRSDTAENLLSADNLLYLNQYTSTSDGTLDITYTPIENVTNAVLLAFPAERTIAEAVITMEDMVYNGRVQTVFPVVTYGNQVLKEDRDYTLSGNMTAQEIGTYRLIVTGMGDYSGVQAILYSMNCEHGYADSGCPACGENLSGDLDADGQINAVDAAMILVAAALVGSGGESDLTELQELAADVNGDTTFDAMDAAEILCYAAAVGSGYTGSLEEFMAA